jgi:hypothetical protein
MFGRRPDATLVPNLSPMRRIMPHISPRRNDSVFYYQQRMEVEAALEFLAKHNRERPEDRPITLFHLLLRSISQMLVLRPGVNRFVRGGRLWQHDGSHITFSAKRELVDGSPLLTIKRTFDAEHESLDEMVDGVYSKLRPARAGVESRSDKETKGLVRLPPFLTGLLITVADGLDRFGLLPRFIIDPDPLYASVFVANVGSVDLDGGFHHLWERGTCSSFCVMGRIQRGEDGRRFMNVYWTYDERIEDGLYAALSINACGDRLEQPELLLAPPSEMTER